jgi:hypothetical protein
MPADFTRHRRALITAILLSCVADAGDVGIAQIGESPGFHGGAPTEVRLDGPAAPSAPAYTLTPHPAVVPSPTRSATLLGQSRGGGGQGSLPTTFGRTDASFLGGYGPLTALPEWEPGRFRSARRSLEQFPRPPPVLSETG